MTYSTQPVQLACPTCGRVDSVIEEFPAPTAGATPDQAKEHDKQIAEGRVLGTLACSLCGWRDE